MFFLENFVGFNVFYVNCRDLSLQVWLKSFQLVIDGEKEKPFYPSHPSRFLLLKL